MTPIPGTTRDVITLNAELDGVRVELTDTGGMFGASEDPLHALVVERGRRAIAEADLIVLVVDGREGLMPGDIEIAKVAREANVPTVLAVNKSDDRRAQAGSMELHELGFSDVIEISAEHAQGIGELTEAMVSALGVSPTETAAAPSGELSIAIVGRPNAGKSSLVNRLLREERMIVSEVPGTTRDPVESVLTWHRRRFRIVDTAGIRRPGRVGRSGPVESLSVLLAKRAIADADIVVLVVDASQGATEQDAAIAGEADTAGHSVVVVANKWDLMKGRGEDGAKVFDEEVRRQLKFLDYAPILHISATTGERASKLLETIDRLAVARRTRVSTGELNRFVASVTASHPPVSAGRRHVRVLYASQTSVAPPTFVFFTNVATSFHFSYERFLVNQLRAAFGFEGTPIRIHVRRRGAAERTRGSRGTASGAKGSGRK